MIIFVKFSNDSIRVRLARVVYLPRNEHLWKLITIVLVIIYRLSNKFKCIFSFKWLIFKVDKRVLTQVGIWINGDLFKM